MVTQTVLRIKKYRRIKEQKKAKINKKPNFKYCRVWSQKTENIWGLTFKDIAVDLWVMRKKNNLFIIYIQSMHTNRNCTEIISFNVWKLQGQMPLTSSLNRSNWDRKFFEHLTIEWNYNRI